MKNKLFFILLVCSLNTFSQEFKKHYYQNRFELKDSLEAVNLYGTFKRHDTNHFWIKIQKSKKHYEILVFRQMGTRMILEKVENYKGNQLDGYFLFRSFGSEQGYYKNGKKHGFWVFSSDIGVTTKGYYKKGKKHGYWEEDFETYIEKGRYKNDLREGWWIFEDTDIEVIDENGNKKTPQIKIFYKKGVKIK
ncbi:hypothetical protein [Capnocytophaga cynodegmi]|uniref:hypothetical protein n=1 Tax=Capnocytophaga cynodegmi TaxID=28189 RepID=UPI00385CEEB4